MVKYCYGNRCKKKRRGRKYVLLAGGNSQSRIKQRDPNDVVVNNVVDSYAPSVMAEAPMGWKLFDKGASWLLPGYDSAKSFAEGIESKNYLKAALGLGGAAYSVGTLFAPQLKVGNLLKGAFPFANQALNRLGNTAYSALGEGVHKIGSRIKWPDPSNALNAAKMYLDYKKAPRPWFGSGKPPPGFLSPNTYYSLNPNMPKGHDYFSPQNFGKHASDVGASPFSPLYAQDALPKGKLHFKNDGGWASALPTAEAFKASLTKDAPRKVPKVYDYNSFPGVRKKLDMDIDPFAALPNKGKDPM